MTTELEPRLFDTDDAIHIVKAINNLTSEVNSMKQLFNNFFVEYMNRMQRDD